MTCNTKTSFEKRLEWISNNVAEYEAFEESKRMDDEIEEYRLKKRSTEYPKVGGVRE